MPLNNVRTTLQRYVNTEHTWFYWYHGINRMKEIRKYYKEIDKNLPDKQRKLAHEKDPILESFLNNKAPPDVIINDFFESTLDEVRIKKANYFAYYALIYQTREALLTLDAQNQKWKLAGKWISKSNATIPLILYITTFSAGI